MSVLQGLPTRSSRRRKIHPRRITCILVLVVALAVYTAVSLNLTLHSAELHSGWRSEWKLGPETNRATDRRVIEPKHPLSHRSMQLEEPFTSQLWHDMGASNTTKSSTVKFGFVMRDFARRVLSRHISSSNVVVVASDAVSAAKEGMRAQASNQNAKNVYDTVDFESPYSLGGTFLLHAAAEGHDIHAIDFVVNSRGDSVDWQEDLDTWWNAFELQNDAVAGGIRWWSSTKSQPKWIIAAVFDHYTPGRLELTDTVWSGADAFLKASTITYVVVGMHSRKRNDKYEFGGLAAARTLLEYRYKLQTLAMSHYYAEPGQEGWTEQRYGPNAIFKTREEVEELLKWGADQASRHGEDRVFTAYIFATQGLDLAIPSSRVYIDDSSRVIGTESTHQINLYKSLQFKPCPQANMEPKLNITFSEIIGETSVQVTIPLAGGNHQIRHYHPHANADTGFTYQFTRSNQHFQGPRPEEVDIWFSNRHLNDAEAACARLGNFTKCATRVIDRSRTIPTPPISQEDDVSNIFLIMIDPISRPHFHRSMPRTTKVLGELGFLEFGNYTSIGPNSGKNQAALYSGMPLADRSGIQKNAGNGKWLWDRLGANGFVTLKAENGCIENSNMLKSLRPSTTHGDELSQLFCFDFDRPNCLGPDLAAQHLMMYGEEFLTMYEKKRKDGNPYLRWAVFLHFIDTHEDTMMLSSLLDAKMSIFLSNLGTRGAFEKALAIITSDHGLHYGPYFQSRSGRREATEPVLFIRLPSHSQRKESMSAITANARKWITPFDVHETILSVSLPKDAQLRDDRKGTSLLKPWEEGGESCDTAEDIPAEYCSLRVGHPAERLRTCTKMPRPPNVLSFYGDLLPERRSLYAIDCKQMTDKAPSKANVNNRCQCATSHRGWYRCSKHPWGDNEILSKSDPEEYFALVKCGGQKMSVDTRVLSSHPAVSQSKAFASTSSNSPPNILVIEVDSVSLAYAERHLPKTRSFLKRYRMKRAPSGTIECSSGICAPDFTHFSLNGPNSIANQVAILSGCVVARFHGRCFEHQDWTTDKCSKEGMFTNGVGECTPCPKGSFLSDPLSTCRSDDGKKCCTCIFPAHNMSRICQDSSRDEYGMQLFRRGPRRHVTYCPCKDVPRTEEQVEGKLGSPWIFDVAKELGYVTYFGDEFCYEGSPFVVQNNIFPLSPDFELQRLYCRLQESHQYNFSKVGPRLCAHQNSTSGAVSSNPGFDLIRELWSIADLADAPKFVYLNAMAAHDYDPTWIKMVSVAEEYDEQLRNFLHFVTLHPSFSNTVVVVRADHGLQGGPAILDYSMQVEHREPWTQMLLPQVLVGGRGMATLHSNQDKIVTGHDLYRTLRGLMELSSTRNHTTGAAMPAWSYNVLHDSIPAFRTCRDAKVPTDFCPCEELVHYRPPSHGVCNPFDQYGDLFCTNKEDVILPDVLEM